MSLITTFFQQLQFCKKANLNFNFKLVMQLLEAIVKKSNNDSFIIK